MAAAVESAIGYPESPMDSEDVVYPCKGCGEILEEGKAFELAGNRWHIDCFRCNTCGTLLDSDANLLLLGDGSLICNNCTYSCNACGNKIEDLAILTGDQAFCANCFKCRNCRRKIENLRYARTSQGIFCMTCHESLMARRRKKANKSNSRAAPSGPSPSTTAGGSTHTVDKALPSLPPGALHDAAFTPDTSTPSSDILSGTPTHRSPSQRTLKSRKEPVTGSKRDPSPISDEARKAVSDGPTLPASTYKDSRSLNTSPESDDGAEQGFLPMAFDPTPMPRPPVHALPRKQLSQSAVPTYEPSPPQTEVQTSRDYFTGKTNSKAHREVLKETRPGSERSISAEREPSHTPVAAANQPKASPHIAYQEKGRSQKRVTSGQNTPGTASLTHSPITATNQERQERPKPQTLNTSSYTLAPGEGFKLQDVPKGKKAGSRSSSKADGLSPILVSPVEAGSQSERRSSNLGATSPSSGGDSPNSSVNPFDDPKRNASVAPPSSKQLDRPARGDSLASASLQVDSQRTTPEPYTPTSTLTAPSVSHERDASRMSSIFVDAPTFPREQKVQQPSESPRAQPKHSFDAPPPRASSRPSASNKPVTKDEFVAPRNPPPPPPFLERHKYSDSVSTLHSSDGRSEGQSSPALRSAGLPKASMDGGFSMDKEMARILRGNGSQDDMSREGSSSVLRRVSNAVKHGRSFSDRVVNGSSIKSPAGTTFEPSISSPMLISSPLMTSPGGNAGFDAVRAQLRRAQSRITELEAEKNGLQEKLNGSSDIKQVNNELREKRSTMAFLDSQREMVIRELEVMTEHLTRAKDRNQPLDLNSLKSAILSDFVSELQKVKDTFGAQIEDLVRKRNELTDDIGNLIQMKDKGFQEYEAVSTRNTQLQEMNSQLMQSIQEQFKNNKGLTNGSSVASLDSGRTAVANGLGIYHPGAKPETPVATDLRTLNPVVTDSSMPNLLHETEAEPATVLTAPQVVNIRKGQPKKFNWRKGGEKMAKNVTKGLKGAFANDRKDGIGEIGLPYSATQQAVGGSDVSSLNGLRQGSIDPNRAPGAAGFGFFGQKNGGLKNGQMGAMRNGSSTNLAAPAVDPSVLFGSDLEARCEFEKRLIPSIVTRCIEEVEARGMDVEGVYRKSGGSGQVKSVQAGFEKDGNHDISDPDLDIHAVTSALKQYFRKLPTPLITYDVYESLLEAGQQTSDRKGQVNAMRMALGELPEHHRNCLELLVQHLARVMAHEKENLMTPLNLAVVFAPTIMRPLSIEREMTDMQAQRVAVQALLELQQSIFEEDEE